MIDKYGFTDDEKLQIAILRVHVGFVRGIQIFILAAGIYFAIFGGRGWVSVICALILVAWLQSQMPELPPWLERYIPKK